jgi:hypothetical protein
VMSFRAPSIDTSFISHHRANSSFWHQYPRQGMDNQWWRLSNSCIPSTAWWCGILCSQDTNRDPEGYLTTFKGAVTIAPWDLADRVPNICFGNCQFGFLRDDRYRSFLCFLGVLCLYVFELYFPWIWWIHPRHGTGDGHSLNRFTIRSPIRWTRLPLR